MKRRSFLGVAATSAALSLSTRTAQADSRLPIKKGVLLGMLPKDLPFPERLKLAKDVGFAELECPTTRDQDEVQAIRDAAKTAGIRIHSVMNSDHWKYPLSSADPKEVALSMDCMEVSLRNAKFWGADTVLLVPAVVNADTSYGDAWKRSQKQVRELIPLAKELGVIIAVENVWNKFLLSPLEMANYVDELDSEWVKAYFDVGNVVLFGYPQDWIRTLGNRIAKVHLKDFSFHDRVAKFVPLRDGDVDWKEIYAALGDIGYKGTVTTEVRGGDKAALQEISNRVDLILTNG